MKLVNVKRLRPSTSLLSRSSRQEIESDRGRVLFSAPLRRLQRKAQVFSLESNAAVRSRLTHSMEVSHVGRYIVQKVREKALVDQRNEFAEQCLEIETIVETACLLHDIGNPPFGHLGEKAIQNWFKSNAKKLYAIATNGGQLDAASGHYLDFVNFDGNPQGVRICVSLQGLPGNYGFNLTYSLLGAILKYPKSSSDCMQQYSKIGVFQTELDAIKSVWREEGLVWGERNKLVYLMEAADDIAYSLSDIEDGIEKKIVDERSVLEQFESRFADENIAEYRKMAESALKGGVTSPFVSFRTSMINSLVGSAAGAFYKILDEENVVKKSLLAGSDEEKVLKIIGDFCKENLYRSPEAEDIEIAGYNIVHGLLEKFSVLLELSECQFSRLVEQSKGPDLCRRMFSKLPNSLVDQYRYAVKMDGQNEWYHRVRLVIDYVCGMTDDFSLKVYRLLHGISVETI
ncbi:dGTP triphosphohydrolase [Simiduia agarivorans]|uniref:Deoxyguanosinetriphosphate triphosphohydrolase n=1 Tax=Simiduia agarivorans (strain DSM 21679 / JCM 13881 / BCRC 17597 / SA1) TaxID=1117647 RepID=K4KH40_SIMAS|nr:dNTP triphosphohydrolase [Simiduia agarivorans]AFU98424.2 deoxyguanosinetriphosphate triphosphohydrolase [Simiduia agarivorans SA1 = DSM 21679]